MFNKLRNRKSNKKGFTLIELIIVIAILGILAAILVPSMLNIVSNSKAAVAKANCRTVYSAAQSTYVSLSVNGAAPDAATYTQASDPFGVAIVANLGTGFGNFSATVANGMVSTITYGGYTYSSAGVFAAVVAP